MAFHTGERATGVASHRPGQIEFGFGRKNSYDDDKGLPDGIVDESPLHLILSIGLYDHLSDSKLKAANDYWMQPIVIVTLNHKYEF